MGKIEADGVLNINRRKAEVTFSYLVSEVFTFGVVSSVGHQTHLRAFQMYSLSDMFLSSSFREAVL